MGFISSCESAEKFNIECENGADLYLVNCSNCHSLQKGDSNGVRSLEELIVSDFSLSIHDIWSNDSLSRLHWHTTLLSPCEKQGLIDYIAHFEEKELRFLKSSKR